MSPSTQQAPQYSGSPATVGAVSSFEVTGEIRAERLPDLSQPQNWDNWQAQIHQMIPRNVTLSRHIILDWKIDLNDTPNTVDIYIYNLAQRQLSPMVRIENPDLSFSRRMEDAVGAVDDGLANVVRDAATNGHRLVGVGPIIVYRNKQLHSPKMFGPTIDTLMMCSVIDKKIELLGENQSVLEVGTGNGMISKMMLQKFHSQLNKLFATDLSAVVLNQAAQNILSLTIAEEHKDKLVTVRDPTFLKDVRPESLQLIVSNPPYIPDLRGDIRNLNQAITGLDVYQAILGEWGYRALQDNGRALLILSSVSAESVRNMVQEGGRFEERGVLSKELVPFDLADVTLDREYQAKLLEQNIVYEINRRTYHMVEVVEFGKRGASSNSGGGGLLLS